MNRSIIFGAVLISGAILVNGYFERRSHDVVPANSKILAVAESPDQVIAVLPFTGFDATDQASSLAAGIQLEIVSRLTAQHVKAAQAEERPRDGRVLFGSVQRVGDKVRVTVQLIDAASGIQRWGEHYDRKIDDVLAIESEIAASVAKSVAAEKT